MSTHPSTPGEPLWSAADVATFLKVSRSWVYQRAEAGDLPCRRLGGLLRFDPEAIRAYARGDAPQVARVVALRPRGGAGSGEAGKGR